ncbi:hypothetical protein GWI33_004636 [Rhynchophorus ferrugineus]|uniref:Fatty acyl-CoA reductase n=1 Tax=Rhynchophorus ferrugineus TaxID=354439 RepID=A0A834IV08_RHYFE|nr:hypothetical protein GWI33_004636 [Rhynchophorus ferrugineus]
MLDESNIPTVLRKKLPSNLEKIKNGTYNRDDFDYPVHLYLKENDIRIDEEGSDIIPFLRGKSVLITGATGFLGKLLIEKLIRCCKDIGTIYVIIRSKKGKDIQQRINEFLDNWVFIKLSEIYPDYKNKVVGISGDFDEDGIGLTEESKKLIADKVNIIYHVAATVRFDEKIKKAVTVNIKGTQEMIKIAKSCKNLIVFVYISSAFANCHLKTVGERFYEPVMNPDDLINLVDNCSDDILDKITPELLGTMPNTYAFTKQIAEEIVRRECVGITACIQRPSVVISSVKEPIRSWTDNLFGPVGLIEGIAMGLVHVQIGNISGRADLVPVDYVINNSIAAAYKTAKDGLKTEPQIFNFTCHSNNRLVWNDLHVCANQGVKVGSNLVLWKHFNFMSKFYNFISESLGRKPILRKAYKKIDKFCNVLAYFTLNEWTFEYNNTATLWKNLNDKDKINFPFDMENLDWKIYFDTYIVAMREFLLNEFLDNLEQGRAHLKRITILHYALVSLIIGLSYYFCFKSVFVFIPLSITLLILIFTYGNKIRSPEICNK